MRDYVCSNWCQLKIFSYLTHTHQTVFWQTVSSTTVRIKRSPAPDQTTDSRSLDLLVSTQSMKQLEWIEETTTWQCEVNGEFGGMGLPYGLNKNEVSCSCSSGCNLSRRKGSSLATSTRIPPPLLLRWGKSRHCAKGNQVLMCLLWKSCH